MDTPFAAVLLAGGQGLRMGQDKALLPLPDGRRLWERQLTVLRALEPAELFISGPPRAGFPDDVPQLADETSGLGPLAGITAALRAMHSPRLVVLAVDLPMMVSEFLCSLVTGEATRGVVPQMADGFLEPLAAVYLREALATAETQLRGTDRSLQSFVRSLVASGLAATRPVANADAGLFTNWNYPQDFNSPKVRAC